MLEASNYFKAKDPPNIKSSRSVKTQFNWQVQSISAEMLTVKATNKIRWISANINYSVNWKEDFNKEYL